MYVMTVGHIATPSRNTTKNVANAIRETRSKKQATCVQQIRRDACLSGVRIQ